MAFPRFRAPTKPAHTPTPSPIALLYLSDPVIVKATTSPPLFSNQSRSHRFLYLVRVDPTLVSASCAASALTFSPCRVTSEWTIGRTRFSGRATLRVILLKLERFPSTPVIALPGTTESSWRNFWVRVPEALIDKIRQRHDVAFKGGFNIHRIVKNQDTEGKSDRVKIEGKVQETFELTSSHRIFDGREPTP